MKKLALFLAVLSFSLVVLAGNENGDKKEKVQNTQATTSVIAGKVVDQVTGEALAGVQVMLVGTDQVVYTDFDGNFQFTPVNNGKYTIETNFISYQHSVHQNVNAIAAELINISLKGL
ncbi:MAG: carboxypeptidase-like regulatory domain-containing protein [Bacteroidales bacterium]|nr:carboxypeptidase-like regulatory domain-containing protein [Bacteroidales bacterium]